MLGVLSFGIMAASVLSILAVWFFSVYHELTRVKNVVISAKEQMAIHYSHYVIEFGGEYEKSAKNMYHTSCMVYTATIKNYNRTLIKPAYCIPAFLMGFRGIQETDFT